MQQNEKRAFKKTRKKYSLKDLEVCKEATIPQYLEANRSLLQRRESAREAEYAAAKSLISRVVIKAEDVPHTQSKTAINRFVHELYEHSSAANHWEDKIQAYTEISGICGDFITPIIEQDHPVQGIFKSSSGEEIRFSAHNYIAHFNFRSFCISLSKVIALKIKIASFEPTLDGILVLIIAVAETLALLVNAGIKTFSDDERVLLKQIIIETKSGKYDVDLEQLLTVLSGDNTEMYKMYSGIVDKFLEYQLIDLEEGKLSLKDKVYF